MRNLSAAIFDPTDRPRKMVTVFIRAFCIVSLRRSMHPHSRARFPIMRAPMREQADGSRIAHTVMTSSGKMIFSSLETGRICCILIFLSFSVVSSLIIGGWMIGTRAM